MSADAVAALICFLASDDAADISGTNVPIDQACACASCVMHQCSHDPLASEILCSNDVPFAITEPACAAGVDCGCWDACPWWQAPVAFVAACVSAIVAALVGGPCTTSRT